MRFLKCSFSDEEIKRNGENGKGRGTAKKSGGVGGKKRGSLGSQRRKFNSMSVIRSFDVGNIWTTSRYDDNDVSYTSLSLSLSLSPLSLESSGMSKNLLAPAVETLVFY